MGVRKPALELVSRAASELQRLREALGHKQALIDAMMDASYDGLCLLSGDGVFLEMNAAFERMTGLKREAWVGRPLKEMQHAPGITRRSAALQVLNGSYPASTLVNIRGGDMMLVTANPHFEALQYLLTYEVPGNVRQLKNPMARLVLTCPAKEIALADVLAELERYGGSGRGDEADSVAHAPVPTAAAAGSPQSMREHLAEIERALLARYAGECRSTYEVAARLGMNQSSVVRKMKKYGITRADN